LTDITTLGDEADNRHSRRPRGDSSLAASPVHSAGGVKRTPGSSVRDSRSISISRL
jgi:hypothetical protein